MTSLETLGAKPAPLSIELLRPKISAAALTALGALEGLWYLRDEANWWFRVRPGMETAWLQMLQRRFEVVQMIQEALDDPNTFPLSFFVRISHQTSGGDTLLDLRQTPHLLLQSLRPGALADLIVRAPAEARMLQPGWLALREV